MIWFCFSPFPMFAIDSSGFPSSPYFFKKIFFWLWLLSIRYAYVWWLSKEAIQTEAWSRDSFFFWTPLGFLFCDMKFIQQFQWPMASNSRWGCSELSSHESTWLCRKRSQWPSGPVLWYPVMRWWIWHDWRFPTSWGALVHHPFWIGIFHRIFHINHESWGIPHKNNTNGTLHMSLMFPLNINHSLTAKSPMKVSIYLYFGYSLSYNLADVISLFHEQLQLVWIQLLPATHGWEIPVA